MYIGRKDLIILGVVLLFALGTGLAYLKVHGLSARDKPMAIEAYFARHARLLSIPAGARSIKNPFPATPLNIAEGRDHFADHCAVCHANNGSGKTEMGANLYPRPWIYGTTTRDGFLMARSCTSMYVIKNGVRFTGMPGWGGSDEDDFKPVLFIRHLPQLNPDELELMKEVNQMGPEETSDGMNH